MPKHTDRVPIPSQPAPPDDGAVIPQAAFVTPPASNVVQGAGLITGQKIPDRIGLTEEEQRNIDFANQIAASERKSAAIAQQFGSFEAWESAGRPPYAFEGRLLGGGVGSPSIDIELPPGFVTPTPGNPNPNNYDLTAGLDAAEARGIDVGAARHAAEVKAFFTTNPDLHDGRRYGTGLVEPLPD